MRPCSEDCMLTNGCLGQEVTGRLVKFFKDRDEDAANKVEELVLEVGGERVLQVVLRQSLHQHRGRGVRLLAVRGPVKRAPRLARVRAPLGGAAGAGSAAAGEEARATGQRKRRPRGAARRCALAPGRCRARAAHCGGEAGLLLLQKRRLPAGKEAPRAGRGGAVARAQGGGEGLHRLWGRSIQFAGGECLLTWDILGDPSLN